MPEHGVADELLDPAAVPLDLRTNPLVVRRQERPYVLGVELLGAGREADDVDEEDADDPPLLPVRARRQRGTAVQAEARNLRVLLTAGGANRHADSLWNRPTASFSHGRRFPRSVSALAVKDLFDTEGLTTTYGSAIFADHVPGKTAEAVRRLEASGYANVGKTNLHEFAYGVTSMNPHFGWVPNPLAPGRIPGGSSGGSAAALAAGLADAALGTDTGGSIRIPAAYCGIVGFKPTFGLVPLDGCWPLAPSYDHAGPMARTVEECVTMLKALAPGFEPAPVPELADVRVAVAWLDDAQEGVRQRVEAAAALFPNRERIDFPRGHGHI